VADDLRTWWVDDSARTIDNSLPKIIEYGAGDLVEIGKRLAEISHRPNITDTDATELGIYFYLVGKLARWHQAVVEGRRVSDDTLFDIEFYTKMARRNRDAGEWPANITPTK
jgi:hypothetical protein